MAAGGQQTIGEVFGNRLLAVLQSEEEKLDQKLAELDNAGEDEIERMRAERLDQMKKMSKQRAEWVAQGHGSYREVEDQCVWQQQRLLLSRPSAPRVRLPRAPRPCPAHAPPTLPLPQKALL